MKNTKTVKTAKKSTAKKSTAKKSDILTTFIGAKTTGTPCVSVIIPVYNVGPYLAKCLDSVLSQSLRDIEVICVDDGSTDYSLEILKWYASQDSRITVIGRKNMGVGYSRNQGMEYAHGQFIAFMDPDDYYPTNTVLEKLYTAAIENDVKICGGSLVVLDENLNQEQYRKDGNNYFPRAELKFYREFQYDYGFQRYIYETKMLRDNGIVFPNYRRYQDPVFMIRAFATAGTFYVIPDYVYGYRYAHRPVGWNEEKVFGLLSGLRDDLRMAIEYDFEKLYNTTLRRIQVDYKQVINEYQSDRNVKIRSEIMDICLQRAASIKPKLDFTPAVSVVLPIYNAAPYLRECLDSVVKQTLHDIEIICVNDGSTDNSLDIIKQYAARDKRVCYIDKPNAGYGQTMNCGIDMATGEYIGIVEPDDYIKLDMYSTLYAKAKAYDLDVVKSDYYEYTQGKTKYISVTDSDNYDIIINHNITPDKIGFSINPTGIFCKDFLTKYNIRFNETPGASHQDIGYALLLSLFADKFMFINQAFYMYRQDNVNSSMRSYAKPSIMPGEYDFVYEHLKQFPKVFKKVKGIFYKLRHRSFTYFYNNRISPVHQYKFMQDWQQIYSSDLEFVKSIKHMDAELAADMNNVLKKQFETPVIPVVFATDDNYFRYLYITLMSLIKHSNPEKMYHIFVFHTDISDHNLAYLSDLQRDNIKIDAIDVSANIKGQNLYSVAHFSKEMYYRILIPELLSDYAKVLYLDCDILIQRDISALYDTNISKYMVGAIKNPPHKDITSYKHNTLHIDENLYFNSGILLFNTKKCLDLNLKDTCFDLLKKYPKLYCPDQDILNMACKDNIKWIDQRWNFQWGYLFNNVIAGDENKQEYYEASHDPFIIHYTTGIKAWNRPEADLSMPWWNVATESPFYDSFVADLQPKPTAVKNAPVVQSKTTPKQHKKRGAKPYLFFPYYLVAGAWMKYVVLPRKKPNAQQDIRGDMNKILREIADLRRMINNTNNNVSAKNDALTRRVDDILTWVRYFEKKNTDA